MSHELARAEASLALTVLGASAVRPNPGGACSGYLVTGNGRRYLVDCGTGVMARLQQIMEPAELDGVLISHGHPDHILDLVALRYGYLYGPAPRPVEPIPLWVGPGLQTILVDLAEALGSDETFWSPFRIQTYEPTTTLHLEGLQVDFAPCDHYIDCWAMRFETRPGEVLVYTADTGPSETVGDLAKDANILLAEATLPRRAGYEDDWGHLAAAEAGTMAAEAGAERLLLTHYWSETADALVEPASKAFGRRVEMAQEMERYGIA